MKTSGAGLIFPSVLIALQLGAAVVYACQKDWRHVLYWLGACVVVAAVTF
jgi:hypothetical protein